VSVSGGPSPSLVTVLVVFRAAVFFAGAGGSLGFIAAALVVRVAVAGAGSLGVTVFERVALVVIVAVDVTGFGNREAILCTWPGRFLTGRVNRRDASQVTFCLLQTRHRFLVGR
jgi:hypothetical protein